MCITQPLLFWSAHSIAFFKEKVMELQQFAENGFTIRCWLENSKPLFVAKDILLSLGLEDTNKAVEKLDDDEKLTRKVFVSGQNRDMTVITESGLYSLVLRSNKPEAKKFRKWVTSEVLPSIRKTGSYSVTQNIEQDNAAFYDMYETLNLNNQFYIQHRSAKALAYADIIHGFLISSSELARLTGTSPTTIKVLRFYYKGRLLRNVHIVVLGKAKVFFTRLGAGFVGLHSGDGSVGRYILSKEFEKQFDLDAKLLHEANEELLARFEALGGAK
jgi:prophage antirepressor-like protein